MATMTQPTRFQGLRILLVSPQPWDHLQISKHHYAISLGLKNTVFFLSPPELRLGLGAIERRATQAIGVEEVRWRPRVPPLMRFHAPNFYRAMICMDARRLARHLGGDIDIVWCFDVNTFPNLRAFGAHRTIFHPVDPLSSKRQARVAETADLVLSVSPEILASVTREVPMTPAEVIPHGIGPEFMALAVSEIQKYAATSHCGYFGNLDRSIIDFDLLAAAVKSSPATTFHFWGPASPDGAAMQALGSLANVRLHGAVSKVELARQAASMDAFLLAYREHRIESDLSNSHKILEYFATGRVVVSTYMSCHNSAEDLLVRTPRERPDDFPSLVNSVLRELDLHNSIERMNRRKALASDHGYEALLNRIAGLLKL
jgi:glycosyltransferase involved in cell wall biosynthesis